MSAKNAMVIAEHVTNETTLKMQVQLLGGFFTSAGWVEAAMRKKVAPKGVLSVGVSRTLKLDVWLSERLRASNQHERIVDTVSLQADIMACCIRGQPFGNYRALQ